MPLYGYFLPIAKSSCSSFPGAKLKLKGGVQAKTGRRDRPKQL